MEPAASGRIVRAHQQVIDVVVCLGTANRDGIFEFVEIMRQPLFLHDQHVVVGSALAVEPAAGANDVRKVRGFVGPLIVELDVRDVEMKPLTGGICVAGLLFQGRDVFDRLTGFLFVLRPFLGRQACRQ